METTPESITTESDPVFETPATGVSPEPGDVPAITDEPAEPVTPKGKKSKAKSKAAKAPKVKVVRDSFTMPKDEYAQIAAVKSRCLASGIGVKKSELLRAGIVLLAKMSAEEVAALVAELPVIKTGRPKKRK